MSFDLYFFRLAEGKTVAEANQHLESIEDDFDEDEEEFDDDEETEDPNSLQANGFVDLKMTREDFDRILGRAFFNAMPDILEEAIEDGSDRQAIQDWLNSDGDQPPAGLDLSFVSDFDVEDGMLPVMLSLQADLEDLTEKIVGIVKSPQFVKERLVVLDPQIGEILDADSIHKIKESAAQTQQFMEEALSQLMGGGGPQFEYLLPESTFARKSEGKDRWIEAEVFDDNGQSLGQDRIGAFGQMLIAQETFLNLIPYLDDMSEAVADDPDLPDPQELFQWYESLADDPEDELDETYWEGHRDLTLIDKPGEEWEVLSRSSRRFFAYLFLNDQVVEGDDIFPSYMIVRYCLGALTALTPIWTSDNEKLENDLKVSEALFRNFSDTCDKAFEAEGKVKVWLSEESR